VRRKTLQLQVSEQKAEGRTFLQLQVSEQNILQQQGSEQKIFAAAGQ
jgi:hypothetical protein